MTTRGNKSDSKPVGLHRFLIAIKGMLRSNDPRDDDPIMIFCRDKPFTSTDHQAWWQGFRCPCLILNVPSALAYLTSIGCTTVADFINLTKADPRMLYYDRVDVGTSISVVDCLRCDFWLCEDVPDDAALTVLKNHVDLRGDDLTIRRNLYDFMEKKNIENWFWLHEWIKKEWQSRK